MTRISTGLKVLLLLGVVGCVSFGALNFFSPSFNVFNGMGGESVSTINLVNLKAPSNQSEASSLPPAQTPEAKNCATLDRGHRENRFYRKDICYTREEVTAIIRDLVFNLTAAFHAHNVTYFLESGTLLGSYREHGVIKHDKDGDLGIDEPGYLFIRDNRVPFPPEYSFAVYNSTLYDHGGRDDKLPARLIHKESALYVDVFAFLDSFNTTTGEHFVGPLPSVCYGNCRNCPRVGGNNFELKLPYDWVYPLVDCPFEGQTLKCPRQTAKYLEYMYGTNFMTPAR